MKRVVTAELLDSDTGSARDVEVALTDLRFINRWFGGERTMRIGVERIAGRLRTKHLSLLEVAAGSGQTPRLVKSQLQARGIEIDVSLLDRMPSHLASRVPIPAQQINSVAGDALQLPFRDNSFDVVSCTLFAHHLSASELVTFITGALRVCRHAVLINDLVRHRFHLLSVFAGLPLFRSPITWNDAPASVRQAFTVKEMSNAIAQTPAASFTIESHYLFRMAALIWKSNA